MSSTEQALAQRGGELQTATQEARQQYEIQSAMTLAQRFPRDEALARKNLLESCKIAEFAEDAFYSFPRGKGEARVEIYGPSIHLAREAARIWRNIWHGVSCIRDDDETRLIRAEAWDLENNNRQFHEDQFNKIVFRKGKGWITVDERDLRELNNRRGALAERNAIVALLPKWFIDKCVEVARETVAANAGGKDMADTLKKMVVAFADFTVQKEGATADELFSLSKEALERYLGHPVESCTPQEVAKLKGVYKSIKDGYSKWSEYVPEANGNGGGEKQENKGTLSPEDLAPGKEENRGHGQDKLDQVKPADETKPVEPATEAAAPETKGPAPDAAPPSAAVITTAQDPAPTPEQAPAATPEPGAWKCGKFLQVEIEHQIDRLESIGWTRQQVVDLCDTLFRTRNLPGLEEQQAKDFLAYIGKQKRRK